MRRRTAAAAAVLAVATAAPPSAADHPDHGIEATCSWAFFSVPDTNTLVLRLVAESHVTGHAGLFTNDVECTVWTATEAIQIRSSSVTRDQVTAGGGLIRAAPFSRCVRATAQWTTTFEPSDILSGGIHAPEIRDDHRGDFSDPPGCLPPCHLIPRPAHCAVATEP